MLQLGLTQMGLRYLAAFGFAYLAFLGLLWLWLRTEAANYADIADFSNLPLPDGGTLVTVLAVGAAQVPVAPPAEVSIRRSRGRMPMYRVRARRSAQWVMR